MFRHQRQLTVIRLCFCCALGLLAASAETEKMLCRNAAGPGLVRFYFGQESSLEISPRCQEYGGADSVRALWQPGFADYLVGNLKRASARLKHCWSESTEPMKLLLVDRMLTVAPVAYGMAPERADFAVSFAEQLRHPSPLGYLRLTRFYLLQISSGDTTNWERAKTASRLAAETQQVSHLASISRAEAWAHLGDLWHGSSPEKALAAYLGACRTFDVSPLFSTTEIF